MISTNSILSNDDEPPLEKLEQAILALLQRTAAVSLSPPEVAQKLRPNGDWQALLTPVRRAAVALAVQGRLIIYRKGKPVDPNSFSGVYRIGLPRHD